MTKYKHKQNEFYYIFRESKYNEDIIRNSVMCSCFSCGKKFFSSDIRDWAIYEDGEKKTAICPWCDSDTVISAGNCWTRLIGSIRNVSNREDFINNISFTCDNVLLQ